MPSSCGYLEGRSHALWNFKKSTLRKMHCNIMSCTLGSVCVSWEAHQSPSPSSAFCDSLCIYGNSLCIPSKVFQNPEALEHSPVSLSQPIPAQATFPNPSPFLDFLLGTFWRIKGVHTCLCLLLLLPIPLQQRRCEDECPTCLSFESYKACLLSMLLSQRLR